MTRSPGPIRIGRARVWIGTSGWIYPHWRGRFYPDDLPQTKWFEHYAKLFPTVEINNTFYRLPEEQTFEHWRAQARPPFLYAVKANRFLTHIKRLKDIEEPLERFMTRALKLGPRLGPILFQLPPRWKCHPERLQSLLAALAPYRRVRFALEVRDPDWLRDEVYRMLKKRRVALCIHDLIPAHPRQITARFCYLRFHGAGELYGGSYDEGTLRGYAEWIVAQAKGGVSTFAYFNNDANAYAVENARTLAGLVASLVSSGS